MSRESSFDEKAQSARQSEPLDEDEYPSNSKRIVIMLALYLALFLVNLDQNIISTAIPEITDEFHSLSDVGWYGTAYLLPMCSFQLLLGRVYKFYPAKPIFLACCVIFEIGSAVCGAAPNSIAFIFGRAIAGLGCSGIFSGIMVILFNIIPLRQRPIYQGLFGAIFALASVIGPLIGGSFTDNVTWRWCFYINLPIGAVSILVTIWILHMPDQKLDARADGWYAKVMQLDPIGSLAFFPGVICLVLALQWGGTTYSWKDARIIVLFVICGICTVVFIGIQIWKKDDATVPPRIVKKRSIAAAMWFGFFNGAAMMILMYYLPIWFQAVKGVSAIKSGIMLLPLIIPTVIGAIVSGILISKIGYCNPFFYLGSVITPIGAGLLCTFNPSTGSAKWIGYQILIGFGLGFGSQQPFNVVQTFLDRSDMAIGAALVIFTRFLGSAIFLPVAQNVFLNSLITKLVNLPAIDPTTIINGGATELRNLVPHQDLATLLSDYNYAIVTIFYVVVATSAVTIFGTVLVEWRSLKSRASGKEAADDKISKIDESV